MIRAKLVPVDIESMPLLRFSEHLVPDLKITEALSLRGWGIQDLADIDYKGALTHVSLDNSMTDLDVENLILNEPSRFCDFENHIIPYLNRNKNKIKTLYSSWPEKHFSLQTFCNENQIDFLPLDYNATIPSHLTNSLHRCKTPIIISASLEERSDKFSTQMSLYNYFAQKGYKVQVIGTKLYGELLGVTNFPQFMFDLKYSNTEKVLMFNKFIKDIEDNQKPDLIIIGIPGCIGAFIDNISKHFDDIAYLVSNAVFADLTIINTLYAPNFQPRDYFPLFQYKYGWNVSNFVINCFLMDFSLSNTLQRKEYIKIQPPKVRDLVKCFNDHYENPIFFSFDDMKNLCIDVENKLIGYGESNLV